MRQAPLIGVTTSVTIDKSPERAYVNATYLNAVQEAGGIPILVPPHLDARGREALRARLDGIVLTGGGDIDSTRFGEAPHTTLSNVSPARDALEIELVETAIADERPVFAICRGIQVLNVALGGSLYQDIRAELDSPIDHNQTERRDQPTHRVMVRGETRLGEIFGALDLAVNSMHHQAIKRLGRGLEEVAWAADGVIEAVEMPGAPSLVIGVQWHPEELVEHDATARALFRALVEAAAFRVTRG